MQTSMWVPCKLDGEYEINTEFPYQIRRISNKKVIKENMQSNGYLRCYLNRKKFYKHRIIAEQFIPNPKGHKLVDHINRIRSDNRISNLRWVSASENARNKSSHLHIQYNIIDYEDAPDDLIPVEHYGNHDFEFYYYSIENNRFYTDTGVNYRELHVLFNKNGHAIVYVVDSAGKRTSINFNKFKREYGLE